LFTCICVIIAGVLLLNPGIMTKVFGLILLTHSIRNKLAAGLASLAPVRLRTGAQQGSSGITLATHSHQEQQHVNKPSTIEGEYAR
ncbi:FxsA family protein, partial [Pseudoalteromonas sp. S1691]|uniref:FxsA family protein n=1 Tax=Pseudoalteromonas sp. S1691 TaxID=579513 RepID=UPI001486288C